MPTIDLSGVPHRYELFSPSPDRTALVFIHGWLLSHHYWQPLIDILSPEYPCLVYDLRGFGDSRPAEPNAPYTLASYAEDLSLLLDRLNIESAWLVGHSLGGSIALWGAKVCPERVKGVICLNAGGGIYLKEEFERFREAGKQFLQRRPGWLTSVPFLDIVFSRMMVRKPLEPRWGKQRLVDFVRAEGAAALGSLLQTTTEEEVHLLPRIVSRLSRPVYFLAGANDSIMELKYVNHLASFHYLFEEGKQNVVELPDCGHFAMLEQTAAVAGAIASILADHGENAEIRMSPN